MTDCATSFERALSLYLNESPRKKQLAWGTHRVAQPEDTLDWIRPKLRPLGVTRIGDITGLDRIGIPVFQAILPLSRNLSVKLGKGRTEAASAVSAAMEAIETGETEKAAEAALQHQAAATASAELIQEELVGLHFLPQKSIFFSVVGVQ